jgi:hypothetical protein
LHDKESHVDLKLTDSVLEVVEASLDILRS